MSGNAQEKAFAIRTAVILYGAHSWNTGDTTHFSFGPWNLALRKEEPQYHPFLYGLRGRHTNGATWERRYVSPEAALLHVFNRFNENADLPDHYASLSQALADNGVAVVGFDPTVKSNDSPLLTPEETVLFERLFSKYCKQEAFKKHCGADTCAWCPINKAYDEIFHRFQDDPDDDAEEQEDDDELQS